MDLKITEVIEKIPLYCPETSNAQLLSRGTDGSVYLIGDNKVAKFSKAYCNEFTGSDFPKRYALRKLYNESKIAEICYLEGIAVPKPTGVFKVPLIYDNVSNPKIFPAFIREYFSGITFDSVSDLYIKEDLLKRANEEFEKVRKLGIIPFDCVLKNCLYNPENGKIALIDFAHWDIGDLK